MAKRGAPPRIAPLQPERAVRVRSHTGLGCYRSPVARPSQGNMRFYRARERF